VFSEHVCVIILFLQQNFLFWMLGVQCVW
jgi:hypothetical protein